MTAQEFTSALDELGWKQSDFCRMAEFGKNTPSRCVNRSAAIHGWAARFMLMDLYIGMTAHPMGEGTGMSENFAPLAFENRTHVDTAYAA
jgi:hypothetical protein